MPVYVYSGDEQYLLEKAVSSLREKTITQDMAALSHKILKQPVLSDVLETVSAVSFNLGGDTLIEIRDFVWLSKKADTPGIEVQLEELKAALNNIESTKHVLFVSTKVDGKLKFPKWLNNQKAFTIQKFQQLPFWKTDEVAGLLIQEASQKGISITLSAAKLLVEHMGTALQPLVNEVHKLAVYTNGQEITVDDVLRLSNHSENTFKMLDDWILSQNRAEVFSVLEELLLKQHPVQLFALTQSYLDNLFRLKYWQSLGIPQNIMAERTKKHPFKIKKDLEAFGRVPLTRLSELKAKALDMEWKAKSGQLNDRLAFEMLLSA